MGSLHEGHQKLIAAAKDSSHDLTPRVLVSIFINPLQFEENDDFKEYPRNLAKDCQKAYEAGADAIWAPSLNTIFPKGKEGHFTLKAPKSLQNHLCGAYRKNHFDGVATVVLRLLNLVRPQKIFLGEKDWQQLIILRQLIREVGLNVEIKSIATLRDKDGLPYSSRNLLLTPEERAKAIALPEIMKNASQKFQSGHELDLKKLKSYLENNDLRVEYLETVDMKKLTPVNHITSKLCLLASAVHCGKTRLIDHTFLMKRKPIVAIDGPAGAGKSTVTKKFAEKLGLIYLDTGAMYRAVTWLIQKKSIDPNNEKDMLEALKNLRLNIDLSENGVQQVLLNNINITNQIRSPEITSQVSLISSKGIVREILTAQQQYMGERGGIVAEGRDIGTAVFPDAELKVFLTASPQERARRRAIDLKNQGFSVPSLLDLEEQIKERDYIDSNRKIAPLLQAKDARLLITDGMNIDKVIESLITMFREEIPEEIWPLK
ncbi:Pantoate--beta-alanine ligase [Prochlorococcus sp. MIT 0602]|nr:Pantoate--beta-alanine ligase [Prochlorococcus sp. MIT 0602]